MYHIRLGNKKTRGWLRRLVGLFRSECHVEHGSWTMGKKVVGIIITPAIVAMMMPSRTLAGAVRQGARLNRRFVCRV
jgi:hypothetical protein